MIHQHEPIPAKQPKIEPPQLGQWCIVGAVSEKIHDPTSDICTQWQRRRIEDTRMMFIGVRMVRDGYMYDKDDYEYEQGYLGTDRIFRATRFLKVWLYVKDMHSKPVHVLPGDVAVIPF